MRILIFVAILAMSSTPLYADDDTGKHDNAAMLNYSIGYQVGSDFRIQEFELRPEFILKGIEDALRQNQPLLTASERSKAMAVLGEKVVEFKQKQRENAAQRSDVNLEFLNRNASKEGVKTTASGLQYKVIEAGTGTPPGPADTVVVHYRGTLVDGTEFDSSHKRNRPASFRVNQVIRGWTEALQMMSPGAKWQLFIPAELGYGARGAGAKIPPNSTLIFDVELLEIR